MKSWIMTGTICLLATVLCTSSLAAEKPRAARSVHLGFSGPDATAYYSEMTVEKTTPGSYFMACGFNHGYFGIQDLGKDRKPVVIFSVWDPTQGDDPSRVAGEDRVEALDKADDVEVKRFGGEGTGGQSFFPYDWKVGTTYRFLVKATVEGKKTAYAAWFYLPEKDAWKHLVTFRTHTGGEPLRGFYCFLEDFRRDGRSAGDVRRAAFGNGWIRDLKGAWKPALKARFTASGAEWEAKETIDAGVSGGQFYLQTGGDTQTHNALNGELTREKGEANEPQLDGIL